MRDRSLRRRGGAAAFEFRRDVVVAPLERHLVARRQRVQSGSAIRRQSRCRLRIAQFHGKISGFLVAVFPGLLVMDVTNENETISNGSGFDN